MRKREEGEEKREVKRRERKERRMEKTEEMKRERRREIFLTRVHNRGCFLKLSHRQYTCIKQRDKKFRI